MDTYEKYESRAVTVAGFRMEELPPLEDHNASIPNPGFTMQQPERAEDVVLELTGLDALTPSELESDDLRTGYSDHLDKFKMVQRKKEENAQSAKRSRSTLDKQYEITMGKLRDMAAVNEQLKEKKEQCQGEVEQAKSTVHERRQQTVEDRDRGSQDVERRVAKLMAIPDKIKETDSKIAEYKAKLAALTKTAANLREEFETEMTGFEEATAHHCDILSSNKEKEAAATETLKDKIKKLEDITYGQDTLHLCMQPLQEFMDNEIKPRQATADAALKKSDEDLDYVAYVYHRKFLTKLEALKNSKYTVKAFFGCPFYSETRTEENPTNLRKRVTIRKAESTDDGDEVVAVHIGTSLFSLNIGINGRFHNVPKWKITPIAESQYYTLTNPEEGDTPFALDGCCEFAITDASST